MKNQASWTETYFGPAYGELYRKHLLPADRTREEVAFAREVLQLHKKNVVDVASGFGRHARLLAQSNKVAAVDWNASYLQQAMKGRSLKRLFPARGDMRCLPLATGKFDAALLLFNSFGYFTTKQVRDETENRQQVWRLPDVFYQRELVDSSFGQFESKEPESQSSEVKDENRLVLLEIARVLKPAGELLMEVPNSRPLIAAVQIDPRRHLVTSSYSIEEEFVFDEQNMILSNRTWWKIRGLTEYAEYHLKLYSRDEIVTMLKAAGLKVKKTYGDYAGSPYRAASSDSILLHAVKRR